MLCMIMIASCAVHNKPGKGKKQIAIATQLLGEQYYNAGQYTAALKNLLEAYKTIPDDPYLNNSLGLVYLAKDRYELARQKFQRALELKPDYALARNNLGAALLKEKKWEPAIKCFKQVANNLLYATPEIPLSNLGWAYFHQQMYKKAVKYFKKSLELRPGFLVAIHGLATTFIVSGSPESAVRLLTHAIKNNPEAAILYSDAAKAYEALKEFKHYCKKLEDGKFKIIRNFDALDSHYRRIFTKVRYGILIL